MLGRMPTDQRPLLRHADPPADDVAAINAVIPDVETAFNTKDPELGVRHFAADAAAVDVRGRVTVGAEALLEAHRAGFGGPLREQYASYEVADIAFVRPDVALARKLATATDEEGVAHQVGHAMVALYVLVREDGRWWIAARQNTLTAQ
jgi:uncharacterized protein (TIGR02246 family)